MALKILFLHFSFTPAAHNWYIPAVILGVLYVFQSTFKKFLVITSKCALCWLSGACFHVLDVAI